MSYRTGTDQLVRWNFPIHSVSRSYHLDCALATIPCHRLHEHRCSSRPLSSTLCIHLPPLDAPRQHTLTDIIASTSLPSFMPNIFFRRYSTNRAPSQRSLRSDSFHYVLVIVDQLESIPLTLSPLTAMLSLVVKPVRRHSRTCKMALPALRTPGL